MKRMISLVVAMLMLVTTALPAFAVTLNSGATAGTQDVITTDTKANGESGVYWEVTYDAQTTLPWETLVNDDAALVEYSAETHLRYNESLKVTVAPSVESKMVHVNASQYALNYSLKAANGADAVESTVLGCVDAKTGSFRVDIPLSEWNSAPAGEYKDVLTFTAVVEIAH